MLVHVENTQTDLPLNSNKLQPLVEAVAALEGVSFDEVSLYFVDTEEMQRIHAEHFDDPSPTDCMSFPMDDLDEEGYRILGDIVVCPKIALEYVTTQAEGDPHTETALYVVHGLLHLMGYRDKTEKEQIEMRAAEHKHMENLKAHGIAIAP